MVFFVLIKTGLFQFAQQHIQFGYDIIRRTVCQSKNARIACFHRIGQSRLPKQLHIIFVIPESHRFFSIYMKMALQNRKRCAFIAVLRQQVHPRHTGNHRPHRPSRSLRDAQTVFFGGAVREIRRNFQKRLRHRCQILYNRYIIPHKISHMVRVSRVLWLNIALHDSAQQRFAALHLQHAAQNLRAERPVDQFVESEWFAPSSLIATKLEKKVQRDPDEAYAAIGVPAEWIPVIQKMGYLTVDALRKLPAGKFFNDLCGFNKKNKLGLKTPSIEEVKAWCAPAAE